MTSWYSARMSRVRVLCVILVVFYAISTRDARRTGSKRSQLNLSTLLKEPPPPALFGQNGFQFDEVVPEFGGYDDDVLGEVLDEGSNSMAPAYSVFASGKSAAQLMFGKDHVVKLLEKNVVTLLNDIFSGLKLPDLEPSSVLTVQRLTIGSLVLEDLAVLESRPAKCEVPEGTETPYRPEKSLATVSLRARASVKAGGYLQYMGGQTRFSVDLKKTMLQGDLEFFNGPQEDDVLDVAYIAVTRLVLENVHDADTEYAMEMDSNNVLNMIGNKLIQGFRNRVKGILQKAVNDFFNGSHVHELMFPLKILNRIPIGSHGRCVGIGWSYEREYCRSYLQITIRALDLSHNMVLLASLEVNPFVERVLLKKTGLLAGKPTPFSEETNPLGPEPASTFDEALDKCLENAAECRSIWTTIAEGRGAGNVPSRGLVYYLGRGSYPVPDGDELWEPCAEEGGTCYFQEGSDAVLQDWKLTGGHTELRRMMRLRFGKFNHPGDYVEKVAYDDGLGIPCRKNFFNIDPLNRTVVGTFKCLKLRVEDPNGDPDAPENGCPAINEEGGDGADYRCTLRKPCAVVEWKTPTCVAEESPGKCAREPRSKHCWKELGNAAVTSPVLVERRRRIFCDGNESLHLHCWQRRLSGMANLEFHSNQFLPTSTVQFYLPTPVINAVLASFYSASTTSTAPSVIDSVPNVASLCDKTTGWLCLSGTGITGESSVHFAVSSNAPMRIFTDPGGMKLSAALQIGMYARRKGEPPRKDNTLRKGCTLKEGYLHVSRRMYPTSGEIKSADRWAELSPGKLEIFTVRGRGRRGSYDLRKWTATEISPEVNGQNYMECFKLKRTGYLTRKFCTALGSLGGKNSWVSMMHEAKCPRVKEELPALEASAAASIEIGIEVHANIYVAQKRALCIRLHRDDPVKIGHLGQLRTDGAVGILRQTQASMGVRFKSLIVEILRKSGWLRDAIEIGNLNSLGGGYGVEGLEIALNHGIYVAGNVYGPRGASGSAASWTSPRPRGISGANLTVSEETNAPIKSGVTVSRSRMSICEMDL
eukprot:TRINITY_DN17171_c1_g8_i1.p1 TRINITY_DN17171_c1_g8~~TRINITY_DN17171_c1_g8_i1.p1  ORF type:complete len:1062 (+),score=187.53 TRINITY_DN17171_c1_g8_i1:59-3187(+)